MQAVFACEEEYGYGEEPFECFEECYNEIDENAAGLTCESECPQLIACAQKCVDKCVDENLAWYACHDDLENGPDACVCLAAKVDVPSIESFALKIASDLGDKKNLRA